jgi:hypothetical protein
MNRVLALIVAAAIAACASAPLQMRQTTETPVHASYDRTWSALIDYVTSQNIPIKTTDKASGLLQTSMGRLPRSSGIASCTPAYATAVFIVHGDTASSVVHATARFFGADLGECTSSGQLEQEWEHGIRDRAEGKTQP